MLLKCHEAACVFACILYITVILRLQSAIASESCTDFLLVGNYSCLCFTGMSVNYWTGAGQTGFFKRIFYFKLMGDQRSVLILALCGNHTTTLAKKCDGEKKKCEGNGESLCLLFHTIYNMSLQFRTKYYFLT